MLEKIADFGDTSELRKEKKQLYDDYQETLENLENLQHNQHYLEETIEKLKAENNSLKSMFREILSAEDKKAVIKEIFEDKKDDLGIDFERLIKEETKNYIEDAIKEKYRSEDEW
jgi:predicted nuclease with TOPRIM domain